MKTQVIKLNPDDLDISLVRRAGEVVASGGLVAFPTETVYGLACRVSGESLKRLNNLKGREQDKHYTLHIGDKAQLSRYVPKRSLRQDILVANAWPGPLTIVFELGDAEISELRKNLDDQVIENLYRDNSVGIRCPDNAVAAALLNQTACPVVAPSANCSGAEAPVTAQQVAAVFDGRVEMILDAGPTKYKQSSTIAKIGKKGAEILRQGVYSRQQIIDFSTVHVLFVCTGNTCRSPMAEGVFRKSVAEKLGCAVDQLGQMGYKTMSAGVMGVTGWPASGEAIAVCRRNGIDISHHASNALTERLIRQSDLIYVMSRDHRQQVLRLCPDAAGKCMLLVPDQDVPDPIGQDEDFYKTCFTMIDQAVARLINELKL